jgi:hypothetical protein
MKAASAGFVAYLMMNVGVTAGVAKEAATQPTNPDHPYTGLPDTRELEAAKERTTLFGQPLNSKSRYGLAWFPETLRAPEMDIEYSEMRLDYFHSEGDSRRTNEVRAEFEQSFGSLTLELELPYLWEQTSSEEADGSGDHAEPVTKDGFSRIEMGARYPLFQYVSPGGDIDYTCVGAFELALPGSSHFGRDTEISPRVYQLLRVGDHASVQTSIAYAVLVGPENGGGTAMEYGFTFGYSFAHDEMPIPGVVMFTPIFELVGENVLSGDERGANPLFGVAGVRFYTEPVWFFQPRIGIGYEFPLNHHAQDELDWGVLLSCNFEL